MGTECIRTRVKNGEGEKLSVPPGFVSLKSFMLKRVKSSEETCSFMALGNEFEPKPTRVDTSCNINDIAKLKRSLKRRLWILDDQYTHKHEESDSEQLDMIHLFSFHRGAEDPISLGSISARMNEALGMLRNLTLEVNKIKKKIGIIDEPDQESEDKDEDGDEEKDEDEEEEEEEEDGQMETNESD